MREPVGVEREAEVGERLQCWGIFGIVRGEHSGGGGGGLGERKSLIEEDDGGAATVEFEGEGDADDAGAGDADVGVMHRKSLVALEEVC